MFKTTVGIDGMACGMCEEHICSTIRKAMDVKKVSASHKKKLAEIITERPVDERLLREAIAPSNASPMKRRASSQSFPVSSEAERPDRSRIDEQ